MNFVRMMVDFWAGTYGEECGVPLSFEIASIASRI